VIGTTSYAPYAQAIVASGANVAFETLDPADAIGLVPALKAAGFKGSIENGVTYYPGELASQPNEAADRRKHAQRVSGRERGRWGD
jgi:hypothetical protein